MVQTSLAVNIDFIDVSQEHGKHLARTEMRPIQHIAEDVCGESMSLRIPTKIGNSCRSIGSREPQMASQVVASDFGADANTVCTDFWNCSGTTAEDFQKSSAKGYN